MPIDPDTLSSIAADYAKGMTSIRGRRVQRLLKREFAGAEFVVPARLGNGMAAVLGLSESGAAVCATDGTGTHASVVKWLHGSQTAFETQFDLLKDSLPVVFSTTVPIAELRLKLGLQVSALAGSERAQAQLSRVLDVLG